ncbi:MAG: hypothetical protein R3F24_14890 [Gammaproteobacteria bacterium]
MLKSAGTCWHVAFTALVGLGLLLVFGLFVLGTPQGSTWMVDTLSSSQWRAGEGDRSCSTLLARLTVDHF